MDIYQIQYNYIIQSLNLAVKNTGTHFNENIYTIFYNTSPTNMLLLYCIV